MNVLYLSSEDFSLGQLHVSRQLFDSNAQRLQSLTEVISHLSSKGLHRSHIYYLWRHDVLMINEKTLYVPFVPWQPVQISICQEIWSWLPKVSEFNGDVWRLSIIVDVGVHAFENKLHETMHPFTSPNDGKTSWRKFNTSLSLLDINVTNAPSQLKWYLRSEDWCGDDLLACQKAEQLTQHERYKTYRLKRTFTYLELVLADDTPGLQVLADLVQDC